MPFTVIDDGTLDSVLKCGQCGEVLRFSFLDAEPMSDQERMSFAQELAEREHECKEKV